MPIGKLEFAASMRSRPTPAEAALWQRLRRSSVRFYPQVPAFGYILDFYAPSVGLAVEVDGSIHDAQADAYRDGVMGTHRIATLRFTNQEVLTRPDAVMSLIRKTVRQRSSELRAARAPEVRRASAQIRSALKRQFGREPGPQRF